ncbi:16S rRNA (cytosine(967)-C(5))-methyltransferase RsmB [bacterium]|nr:16S rRNA (cytosine(967)-C(5))-methyltransferase RsmB [bacterium]
MKSPTHSTRNFRRVKPRVVRKIGRVPRADPTPRESAIAIYARWMRTKFRIDPVTSETLKRSNWQPRDRALFLELLYGVIRRHGSLEYYIDKLSTRESSDNEKVRAALAVGLYQLFYLDRIPDHAAVDSSVEIVKLQVGTSPAGWVNAILRRAIRGKEELLVTLPESLDPLQRLSIVYSHPQWMINKWQKRLYKKDLETFLKWNNRRPGVTLRVNTLVASSQALVKELAKEGVKAKPNRLDPDFLELHHSGNPADLKPLRDGKASAQDFSQGLVGKLVDPRAGESILDLCAAPGGKTGHLSELCPDCKIVATDKSAERLTILRENVKRCKWSNVEIRQFNDVLSSDELFDCVLVDAPCTGTGVLARRTDLRWRRTPTDVKRMAGVQLELLRYAAGKLKKGGRIIYSTCSVENEENEDIVGTFLSERKYYRLVGADEFLESGLIDERGFLSVWGPKTRSDAVFAARLQKSVKG